MKTSITPAEEKLYNFLFEKAFKGEFLTPNEETTIQRIEIKAQGVDQSKYNFLVNNGAI